MRVLKGDPLEHFSKAPKWTWIRCTSIGMCVLFSYVNVAYGAFEPAKNFWEQRKEAAQKLRQGITDSEGRSTARVPLPNGNATLLAQLPGIDLNLLPNTAPTLQSLPFSPQTDLASPSLPALCAGRPLPRWLESIPATYVSIKDLYLPPSWKPGDFMVVHVQDAHGNVEAQKNIAKAIPDFDT